MASGSGALVVYLALIPVVYLVWGTFWGPGGWTLDAFRAAFRTSGWLKIATDSFVFAGASTAVAVALGTALAYLVVRSDVYLKRVMFAAALVPLVIPGVLHTIAWILLAGPRAGLLNQVVELLVGTRPFNIFSLTGMVFVEGLHLSPVAFLFMVAAFSSSDPALEEAAITSGARLRTVLARVTLPLAAPALLASALVIGVRALEAFEVPALIGLPAGLVTFTSGIWEAVGGSGGGLGAAGAQGVILVALTGAGLLLYLRLTRRGAGAGGRSAGRGDPRAMELGRWRMPATGLVVLYLMVAVALPVGVLTYASFQPYYTGIDAAALTRFSSVNYVEVLSDPRIGRALLNSLILSLSAATIVVLFAAVVSWLTVRVKITGAWFLEMGAFLPLGFPGLVLGVALLFLYLRSPIPIFGTLWILLLSYITRYLPYGMRYSSAAMQGIAKELEDAAESAGASWWQTFRRVLLPLVAPSLVAGWLYIFIVSSRELASSIILYSPGTEVTSVVIWQMWQSGQFTKVAAFGVLMTGALAILTAGGHRLWRRAGIRTV